MEEGCQQFSFWRNSSALSVATNSASCLANFSGSFQDRFQPCGLIHWPVVAPDRAQPCLGNSHPADRKVFQMFDSTHLQRE